MAITFVKKEAVKTKAITTKTSTSNKAATLVQTLVENLYKASKEIEKLVAYQKLYDEGLVALKGMIPDDASPTQEVVFDGIKHKVVFSPQQQKRSVSDMNKAKQFLGNDTFMKIAKVTLADLDKYLNSEQLAVVVVQSQTGPRTHKLKEL